MSHEEQKNSKCLITQYLAELHGDFSPLVEFDLVSCRSSTVTIVNDLLDPIGHLRLFFDRPNDQYSHLESKASPLPMTPQQCRPFGLPL